MTKFFKRPWVCPEHKCTPIYQLIDENKDITKPQTGHSFVCFGTCSLVEFEYAGVKHSNDLRHCDYTPLKGLIYWMENEDDWQYGQMMYLSALKRLWAKRGKPEEERS